MREAGGKYSKDSQLNRSLSSHFKMVFKSAILHIKLLSIISTHNHAFVNNKLESWTNQDSAKCKM